MKVKSALITSASGSIGGATYSTVNGNIIVRAKPVPVQPSTGAQVNAKSAFTTGSQGWRSLSVGDKGGWKTFANTLYKNRLGSTDKKASGFNAYCALNTTIANVSRPFAANNFTTVADLILNAVESPFVFPVTAPVLGLQKNIQSGLGVLNGDISMEGATLSQAGTWSWLLRVNGLPPTGFAIPGLLDGNGVPYGFSTFLSGPVSDEAGFVNNKFGMLISALKPETWDILVTADQNIFKYTQTTPLEWELNKYPPRTGEKRLFSVFQVAENGLMNLVGSEMITIT